MAFTFDTTNSYTTVEEADDYQASNLNRDIWTEATTLQKQVALVMATRALDNELELPGYKTTTTQALRWPRGGVYNRDGESMDSATIPQAVKNATAELAFWFMVSDRFADNETADIKRMKLGSLEMEFDRGSKTQIIPDVVLNMLVDFGISAKGSTSAVKLER